MAEILVLGAGMVGVSTALALQARGHAVTLADRDEPGRETSFGNAGVIQAEAAEPYAFPRDAGSLFRHALGLGNDVVWNLAGLLAMGPALWRYFRASAPARHAAASAVYVQMVTRATADHAPLIAASGSESLITRDGLAIVFRRMRAFEVEAASAARLADRYGIAFRALAGSDWQREEPALRKAPAGAVHYPDSWSVSDPGGLVTAYAGLFSRRGGRIIRADARSLSPARTGWRLGTDVTAEAVVLCLGPWSGMFLRRFGIKVPMVLKRGYHRHYDAPRRPGRPFLDADNGVVLASMAKGLRMTTSAALVPLDAPADPRQLDYAAARITDLIEPGPEIGEPPWFGTRPCLPGMLPMVGPVPGTRGLWVNFGHGHQGFTLGPTTARILAEAMAGEDSELCHALAPRTILR